MAMFPLPVVLSRSAPTPHGGVEAARGVGEQRVLTTGGIPAARGVVSERAGAAGGIVAAVMLFCSAS